MNTKNKLLSLVIVLLGFHVFMQNVQAQAYCALRDPVTSIKFFFPESTRHQSLVKAINTDARDSIGEILPFTLHFNELGKHTLYVAQKYGDALGFVHVRSELTKWGLVEIAWALDTDLKIRNLQFQRCRIPGCESKHLGNALDLTIGKPYSELQQLLSEDGNSLRQDLQEKLGDSHTFIYSIVKSALKTILVTAITWESDVAEINRRLMIKKYFPNNLDIALHAIDVPKESLKKLEEIMGGGGSMVNRESVQSFRIENNGIDEGVIVTARWRDGDFRGIFTWLFDNEQTIIDIKPIPGWPNMQASNAFDELLGMKLVDEEQCNTAAQLVGFELYFLSHNSAGERRQ